MSKQRLETVNQRVVWTISTLVNNALKAILKERQSPMFICSSSVFISVLLQAVIHFMELLRGKLGLLAY